MRNPDAHERLIRPHSLIQAGARWHMRGFCKEIQEFREFNLGRLGAVEFALDVTLPGLDDDVDWQTIVCVRFVPHRDLSPSQQKLVRDEYMAGTTASVFHVRKPMARYLAHAFRVAMDPSREIPPFYLLMVHDPSSLPEGTLWRD